MSTITLADIPRDTAPGTYVSVTINEVGAYATRYAERPFSTGYVHDHDGYVWPDGWHYRHTGDDTYRIYDGSCPIRSVVLAHVTSEGADPLTVARVFEAYDGHCITMGERGGRNGAWRRALLHTRDMCEA